MNNYHQCFEQKKIIFSDILCDRICEGQAAFLKHYTVTSNLTNLERLSDASLSINECALSVQTKWSQKQKLPILKFYQNVNLNI